MLKFCAARAMATSSLTGASLFRETDAHHWTVLWDEADNAFHKNSNPELIGVFNAGHDRYFAIVHRQVPSSSRPIHEAWSKISSRSAPVRSSLPTGFAFIKA